MTKIDRRISYKMVLDCETAPLDRTSTKVEPSNMWAYDLGWVITDKRGHVYKTRSFVIADIFLHEKEAMTSAYYASKIPQYWLDIVEGRRTLAKFYNVRQAMLDDLKEYGITEVYAHNMRFDHGALNNTQRWLSKSKYRYFFPRDLLVCDTLKMARQVVGKMPSYRSFCESNGYLTKRGQMRFTAEILYRFISGNNEFEEEHKGLDDCLIEKEILAYCYKQHRPMKRALFEN